MAAVDVIMLVDIRLLQMGPFTILQQSFLLFYPLYFYSKSCLLWTHSNPVFFLEHRGRNDWIIGKNILDPSRSLY